ncbi:hypothetical protein B296_00012818 [Ensete ventricosum]|uniref:Uncharacterized protein n=1 Tax=Ensete ventricosum TaxID=4639 RepID=A0A426ZC09_ENSVE|nr:hypothetical protein B296_00012818 [Ensete ventricosum]
MGGGLGRRDFITCHFGHPAKLPEIHLVCIPTDRIPFSRSTKTVSSSDRYRGGITDQVSRPIEPEPPNRTTNIKVAGLPTFVTGRCPADSKIDPGGKVVTAPTLAEAKAHHEQVPSRDNPGSSALAQEDKVTPRVGRYLAGRDSPPPQALPDEWVQRKPETDLQSIYRDAHVENIQAIRALLRLRNMQHVFSRDAIPLPNHGK